MAYIPIISLASPNPKIHPALAKKWREDIDIQHRRERLEKLKRKRKFFLISKEEYERLMFMENL
tara:strand:- start:1026 stop:1217 length:192 start_codon:yes stop_codon:yes gene_type:complete